MAKKINPQQGKEINETIYYNGLKPTDICQKRSFTLLERMENNDPRHKQYMADKSVSRYELQKITRRTNVNVWLAIDNEDKSLHLLWERDLKNKGFSWEEPEIKDLEVVSIDKYFAFYDEAQ